MTQPNVLRRRQRGTATLGGAAPSPTRREGYRSTGPPVGRGVATVAGPGERAHAFEATGTTLGQRQAAAQSLAEEQVAARREAERSRVQALRDDARAEHEATQAGLSAEFDAGVPAGQQAWDSSFASPMFAVASFLDAFSDQPDFIDALRDRWSDGITQEEYDYLLPNLRITPWAPQPAFWSRTPNPEIYNYVYGPMDNPGSYPLGDKWLQKERWVERPHPPGVRPATTGILTTLLDPAAQRMSFDFFSGHIPGVAASIGAPSSSGIDPDMENWRNAIGWALTPEAESAVEGWKSSGSASADWYQWMDHYDNWTSSGQANATIGGISNNPNQLDPNWWGDWAFGKHGKIIGSYTGWQNASTRRLLAPSLSHAWMLGQENLPGVRPIVGGYQAEEYLPQGLSSEEAALGITP